MRGSFKDLLLFRNAIEDEFQGRTFEVIAEFTGLDVFDDLDYALTDRSEGFQHVGIIDEPGIVNRFGVRFITGNKTFQWGRHSEMAGIRK